MTVLVTGADGFVGRWVVHALVESGQQVVGAVHPAGPAARSTSHPPLASPHRTVALDLTDPAFIAPLAALEVSAVVHLAAMASVPEAAAEPRRAWQVNLLGTVDLLDAVVEGHRQRGSRLPTFLYVSTGEVYGAGPDRAVHRETDPIAAFSVYAATKAAAEVAVLAAGRRTGVPVVVARPFPHTGPGQDRRFVVPALARRVLEAQRSGMHEVATGNLDPVRDLLDVRDVAAAYVALLAAGRPGEVYNVARGEGVRVGDLLTMLAERAGVAVHPVYDPALARAVDIPYLVGDASRLMERTGWRPRRALADTLQDVMDAQAD